ncbi:MAG: ornithine cyclodeaminase family protein [Acidobacteriota bacterium]|nr:ornithine cyclodeaminase family protein [Acidobacteriota bacterium]
MRDLIPAIEQALIDYSAGRVQQPLRTILRSRENEGWFGAMPAIRGGVMGAKLVAFYPRNAGRGLPTHLATIQLFSAVTGEPLATMDGRLITEMRTAAVSAVAVRRLSHPDIRALAILGAGVQAGSHLEALALVRRFGRIRIWSRNPERARAFAGQHAIEAASSIEEAVHDADAVITVTSAAEPILFDEWLRPGALVVAVGAVGPERRELASEVVRGTVVVESREAAERESGDILLARATIDAEIGELLADPARPIAPGRVVFKSLGMAVEDIAAARLVYEANGGHVPA